MHFFRYIFGQSVFRIALVWTVIAGVASINYSLQTELARQQIRLAQAETEAKELGIQAFQKKLEEVKERKESGLPSFVRPVASAAGDFERRFVEAATQYALSPEISKIDSAQDDSTIVEYDFSMRTDLSRIMRFVEEALPLVPFDFEVTSVKIEKTVLLYEYRARIRLRVEGEGEGLGIGN